MQDFFSVLDINLLILTIAISLGSYFIVKILQKIHDELSKISKAAPKIDTDLKYLERAVKSLKGKENGSSDIQHDKEV